MSATRAVLVVGVEVDKGELEVDCGGGPWRWSSRDGEDLRIDASSEGEESGRGRELHHPKSTSIGGRVEDRKTIPSRV